MWYLWLDGRTLADTISTIEKLPDIHILVYSIIMSHFLTLFSFVFVLMVFVSKLKGHSMFRGFE